MILTTEKVWGTPAIRVGDLSGTVCYRAVFCIQLYTKKAKSFLYTSYLKTAPSEVATSDQKAEFSAAHSCQIRENVPN